MGIYWDSDERSDSESPPLTVAEVVLLCLIAGVTVAMVITLVFFTGP